MRNRPLRALALTAAGALLVAAPLALAAPAQKPITFRHVVLDDQKNYGEPSLELAPDGKHIAVCVPGGTGETSVWYSSNGGKSFQTSHTNSANGGGDCELDFLPNGTLLNADLEVTDSAIHYSKDFGKTWKAAQAAGIEQDRQWFAHSKDGKTVYLVYHDFVAEAELYAQSNDGGVTWPKELSAQPVTNVDMLALPGAGAGQPASLIDQGVNTFSGPMLISPDQKDMYVLYGISDARHNLLDGTPPFGHPTSIVVAHKGLEDSGFSNRVAVPADGNTVNLTSFPSGSVDKAGNVYVIYTSDKGAPGHFHTYFIVSRDHGAHWSRPVKVDDAPLPKGAQVFATGQAGAPGVLDIAWYGADNGTGPNDKSSVWKVHFAQVRGALSSRPSITRSVVWSKPNHRGDICLNGLLCELGGDRSLLDFFELRIGKDGMAQVAYADNDGFGPATAKKGRVIWAKQTSGRSAWTP
ncbi:MAG TPA: sialidase family protein [Mycobacteriales bacterium]|nr:sialidase family protein [Mycobacteriales bacterium]